MVSIGYWLPVLVTRTVLVGLALDLTIVIVFVKEQAAWKFYRLSAMIYRRSGVLEDSQLKKSKQYSHGLLTMADDFYLFANCNFVPGGYVPVSHGYAQDQPELNF
jgi:hypothetical protein